VERGVVVVDEQSDQWVGVKPQHGGKSQHHRCAKSYADTSGQACLQQLPGAVMLADAHGHCVGHPRRHHERHRHNLQRDLVRRQLRAAHGAHAQRREGKQPDFHRIGAANRQAQAPQLAQVLGVQAQQAGAQRVSSVGAVAADVPHQRQRHAVGDDGGDQADAHQAELGQAEHAFDQCVVEQVVQHGAADADDHHRSGFADGAGKTAQGHEAQVAGQGERQYRQELPGRLHVGFSLAEHQQQWLEVPQQ